MPTIFLILLGLCGIGGTIRNTYVGIAGFVTGEALVPRNKDWSSYGTDDGLYSDDNLVSNITVTFTAWGRCKWLLVHMFYASIFGAITLGVYLIGKKAVREVEAEKLAETTLAENNPPKKRRQRKAKKDKLTDESQQP